MRLTFAKKVEKGDNSELSKYGVRLLDGEALELMFDKKRGKVDRVKRMGQGLVLTNHRLIYLEGRKRARASLLSDVRYLEIIHKKRSIGIIILSVLLFAGAGALIFAGGSGVSLDPDDVGLSLIAGAGVGLFGLLTLAKYYWSGSTQLTTEIGAGEGSAIDVTLRRSAKEDAEEFCAAFFEGKLKSEA
ncbi:MAG: hypothetical protein IH861_06825 [Chloroflexi bacterium]|nr:hypothetical protein [Chloroflexota bacterium]